jgi:kynurenine formamidase
MMAGRGGDHGAGTILFPAGQVPDRGHLRGTRMSDEATLRALALKVRNWGRWGPDDEIGTLNNITPETIAAAGRLVTAGKVFALGIPLDRQGPQSGTRQRFNPIHTMFRDGGDAPRTPAQVAEMQGYGGSDDWIVMPLQCATQWDSLAHIFYEGKMYNGYDAALVTSSGAARNSIDKTRDKIAGRGVLLDVARHKGVRALEPGYAITVEDLEATAAAARVSVQRGDLLLIRTGHMSRYLDKKDWRHFDLDPFPGVSVHTTTWMHDKQIAAVASDNYAVEVRPSELPAFRNPFHVVAIANMGLTLGEIFFLEELAADCAADGRYAFLLVAPPLPVTRAVGTPINPYALK